MSIWVNIYQTIWHKITYRPKNVIIPLISESGKKTEKKKKMSTVGSINGTASCFSANFNLLLILIFAQSCIFILLTFHVFFYFACYNQSLFCCRFICLPANRLSNFTYAIAYDASEPSQYIYCMRPCHFVSSHSDFRCRRRRFRSFGFCYLLFLFFNQSSWKFHAIHWHIKYSICVESTLLTLSAGCKDTYA